MEVFFTILVFILVMILAAVLFAGWVFVVMLRLVVNAAAGMGRVLLGTGRQPMPPVRKVKLVTCGNRGCRARNPAEARFCRRCGTPMRAATRVVVRRAAVL
jgi:ribosomal protein L40E